MGTHNQKNRAGIPSIRTVYAQAVVLGRRPIAPALFLAVVGIAAFAAVAYVFGVVAA